MSSVFVWAVIPIKQEYYQDAKRALTELVGITRKEENCLIFQLLENKSKPSVFHLYEEFTSEEALEWHLEQDYTLKVKNMYSTWLAGPLEVTKSVVIV